MTAKFEYKPEKSFEIDYIALARIALLAIILAPMLIATIVIINIPQKYIYFNVIYSSIFLFYLIFETALAITNKETK